MNDAITPAAMVGILSLPNAEAEAVLYDRLRYLDRTTKLAHSEIGFILTTVQAYKLHEHRINPETGNPYSFTRWVRVAAPWGYSTCFAAMKDVEDLRDIPPEHLAEIPRENYPILKQLSTAVRSEPQVIEGAKAKSCEQFTEQIRKDHPDQHIEVRKELRVLMPESALAKVEEAIAIAMERGAMTRSEALEMMAAEALLEWAFEEGITNALEAIDADQSH